MVLDDVFVPNLAGGIAYVPDFFCPEVHWSNIAFDKRAVGIGQGSLRSDEPVEIYKATVLGHC